MTGVLCVFLFNHMCEYAGQRKTFIRILTANSLSPTARVQSLAAGLPGAKEATNMPLSSPIPLSESKERKRIKLVSTAVQNMHYSIFNTWRTL